MHAAKMLMLFEPAFETKRWFPSAAGHRSVAELTPAHRENASPLGFAPDAYVFNNVRAPFESYEKLSTVFVN
jgi:hypothetical protein